VSFVLRPDPAAALATARGLVPAPDASWVDDPPPGYDVAHSAVALPDGGFDPVRRALLGWDVHRASGLRVAADGTARSGTTVVLGQRIGLVWALAPCRVVQHVDSASRAGFAYATLPGHPEEGVEEFVVVREDGATWFEVTAVSRPDLPFAAVAAPVARLVAARATQHYLDAAASFAAEPTAG
jgi:uncharacterized protein (UPF0548 family)